jgi:cathepsin B
LCESITKIYDQANCGSCWAVSAAAVISDRICIQSKQQYRPIISSTHIITCCKNFYNIKYKINYHD